MLAYSLAKLPEDQQQIVFGFLEGVSLHKWEKPPSTS